MRRLGKGAFLMINPSPKPRRVCPTRRFFRPQSRA
nr:MAG TPA: hypothetical protein [Caudoviricetes sp.]